MRIAICPDKFKGSLSAFKVAEALAAGFRRVYPEAEYHLVPIADGGEGTAELFVEALGGSWRKTSAHDALGRSIEAKYGWIEASKTAIIEMSAAAGLWRIAEAELNPLTSSTYGVGEMIRAAIEEGAETVLVGLGGSATNDGGAGMAAALGWAFLDVDGAKIEPIPRNFTKIARIVPPSQPIKTVVRGLCDVRNPLLGHEGATRVYGPQKGVTPSLFDQLEGALDHLSATYTANLGRDFRSLPGSGAAGGLGFGLLAFAGAEIVSGFDAVEALLGLAENIAAADLVLTGEGRIDHQSLHGKGPAEIARLARSHGKPIIAFAGAAEGANEVFDAIIPIADGPLTLDESRRRAAELLKQAGERTARLLKIAL